MTGAVDASGRALLTIRVGGPAPPQFESIRVWIDTGFTGDLVLPEQLIRRLRLTQSGSVDAVLADGTQIELPVFTCFVDLFGDRRRLEVVANRGDYPLLGVGLLRECELRIDYRTQQLTLTKEVRL